MIEILAAIERAPFNAQILFNLLDAITFVLLHCGFEALAHSVCAFQIFDLASCTRRARPRLSARGSGAAFSRCTAAALRALVSVSPFIASSCCRTIDESSERITETHRLI